MDVIFHRVVSVQESSPKYYKDPSLDGYWVELKIEDSDGQGHVICFHCLPSAKWDGLPIGDNTHA